MNVKFINPFVTSTLEVFRTMFRCNIFRGQTRIKEVEHPEFDISGVIGLSGRAKGAVALSLTRNVAMAATASLFGNRPDDINDDVVDSVGELTNMVVGGAKSRLEYFHLSTSLPTVVIGTAHRIAFPSNLTPIVIPFETQWGPISLDVGFIERVLTEDMAADQIVVGEVN